MDQPETVIETPAEPLPTPINVTKRLSREGRWREVEPVRDQLMRECRSNGMSKVDAQTWTYAELDRLYPPLPPPEPTPEPEAIDGDAGEEAAGDVTALPESEQEPPPESQPAFSPAHARGESHLQGLDQIPESWLPLPDNAALQAELSWVQAQRLRIVEDRPSGGTVVHLTRAGSPPPSWATLGWLETSIRSYAKFVDICAKGLASQELESDMVRRERRSIEDVRRLLAETLAAQ